MEAVAVLAAVAKDLVVLHPADGMFHAGPDLAMPGVVLLLAREQGPAWAFAVRDRHAAVEVGAVAEHGHALAVFAQPGRPPGMRIRGGAWHRSCCRDHQTRVRV